jgi:hypothetical protein
MSDEFRIIHGVPTDEELAAIVGVLYAVRAPAVGDAPPATARWARSSRPGYANSDGRPTQPHRDAWRASTLPR